MTKLKRDRRVISPPQKNRIFERRDKLFWSKRAEIPLL